MVKDEILQNRKIVIALFIYAFLLMFFCSRMSPLYPFNEWSDINLYFNIGKGIFNGRTLYTESFDHKGPLIFFIYGFGYLISNTSFLGMYLIESLAWGAMIIAGYLTARLYLDKIYAFIVALVFPVLVLSYTGEGGSAEEFIVIIQSLSLYLFVRYFKDKENTKHKPLFMFIHGFLSAMVILIKINLVLFWFFPLLAVFITLLSAKQYNNLFRNIVAYAAGVAVACLPIFIYLIYNNALSEAWNVYIVLNGTYATFASLGETIEGLFVRFYQRFRYEPVEFFIIVLGGVWFPLKYIANKWGRISLILSFFSLFIIIFISPKYFSYYSIPYYVFTVLGCIAIAQYLRIPATRKAYIFVFFVALILGIKQRDLYGMQISELATREKPKTLVFQFSDKIMQEKNPTLLNLGLDLGNAVFTKTGIIPNVKYFISPNLSYEMYPQMRDEQTRYIEDRVAQFVIVTNFSFNSDYFLNLPAFTDNYTVIDSYVESPEKTYYLYKRND